MEKSALDFPIHVYKEILENSPAGIYIIDLNGVLVYGNKKAEEIVGYKREELIGVNITKSILLDFKGVARAIKLLAMNKLGKGTGPDEFELKKKDGTISTVIIRTNPTKIGGKKLVIGMVEDISERKKLEIVLEDKNKELEDYRKNSISREVKMIQLKDEIKKLEKKIEKMKKR
jgi:PAS domain S-box-containing protein